MAEQGPNGTVSPVTTNAPQAHRDPLIGTVLDGRYNIEKVLGEGGMGLVYKATHTTLGKTLAVKVLRPEVSKNEEIVARFRQEAQSASAIGNQHIIDISDFGSLPDGSTYFVMEFLTGKSLTDALKEKFDTKRTINVAKQLCNALGSAHEIGVVHRDMKPDNVQLIERGGSRDFVKVLDFGIAKVGGAGSKLTQAGQVFGTPHYMSPEQCAGTNVDHRTDIYALGVILYEMACGFVPFDADNLMGILTKHLYEEPIRPSDLPPPTNVPPALEAVIMKCLAKKVDQRYQSMADVAADLDAISFGLTPMAVAEQVSRNTATANFGANDGTTGMTVSIGQPVVPTTKPIIPIMIGIVALALVGGGAAMMMGGEEKPPEDVNVVAPAVAAPAPTPAPEPVVTPEPTPAVAAEEKPAKVTVSSEPAGAEVYLNGALLGNTPFTLDKPKGSQTIEIELREPGYTEHTVQIAALTAETVTIALKPKRSGGGRPSRPSATPAPTPAPTPGPAKTPSKRPATEVLDPWD